ncbi:hypothetical protein [Algicella marina]|uniref:Uncharacterized protein n=1 Tax=Algicella marina TaxID=2683284 RepID=A0A6P1T5B4_9RHOB|nr:hypothetical protein [Algicella marina]QHQ35732.1 hypothetical protein GO499_11360 [Algicella marina]
MWLWLNENSEGLVALGAFVAAFAALSGTTAAAWIASRTARRTHLSGLREKWVNDQRNDLSELIALLSSAPSEPFFGGDEALRLRFHELAFKIRLRMPGASEGDTAQTALDGAIETLLTTSQADPQGDRYEAMQAVLTHSRLVLKEAWEQAKAGV